MSRLYNILDKLVTVEDITPSSVSSFITPNSGYTITKLSVKKCGKMLAIFFAVSRNTTIATNETLTIGTIASQYRPAVTAGGASATFRELVGTDGRVYVRSASQVVAGSQESFTIMYIIS